MGKTNITVYDIASEAGVSVATVSRVLTGSDKVAEETRSRVQAIIDKNDFQPNALARSLYKKQSKMIGFILPDITNPFYSSIFIEAEKHALEQGYTLVLCNSMDDLNNERTYLQTLRERQVDGIIYMGRKIDQVQGTSKFLKELHKLSEKLPIVMINCGNKAKSCFKVRSNEEDGFREIINYLAKKGHKDVALIGGITGVEPTDIKRKIFLELAEKYNFNLRKEYIVSGEYSIESGAKIMSKMLSYKNIPTAIMGINDIVAIGALKVCQMNNVKVPDDIAVTGFDDIPIAHYIFPSLTTSAHDYKNLGQRAVDIIIDINSDLKPDSIYQYSMNFVERESC